MDHKNSMDTDYELVPQGEPPLKPVPRIHRSFSITEKKQSTQITFLVSVDPSGVPVVIPNAPSIVQPITPVVIPNAPSIVQPITPVVIPNAPSIVQPITPVVVPNTQKINDKLRKLDDSHPRFGPIYQQQMDPMQPDKRDAWQLAKKKAWQRVKYGVLGGAAKATKEKILAAIRKVEKEARAEYAHNFKGTRSEFRMMMIRDGCLFIQMAFMILGKSHVELGYLLDDPVFGGKAAVNSISGWMEAMFYVGNQIPLVILKELIKQQFFQDLIRKGNWKPPVSDLRKWVLYEQLVLPEPKSTQSNSHWSCFLVNLIQSDVSVEVKPCDVLHALHNLVLGPPSTDSSLNYKFGKYEGRFDNDVDLEANNEDVNVDNEEIRFSSTMELRQVGVHIKKLKSGGPRNIHFTSFYFCARLYLPALPMDADIASVFRNLKSYEISNQGLGKHNRELCSYISLMSDIIQTPQDLILLQKKGIIEGDSDYAEKLPGILRKFNSKDVKLTYNLRNVRRRITNFSSPLVRYQTVLNLVFLLTLVQAAFAVLAYFKPPS